jgi:hypothetical protein
MSEKSVDFPAPLGPTKPMRSSRFTWSETLANRVRPPNALLISDTVNMQAVIVAKDVSARQAPTRPAFSRSPAKPGDGALTGPYDCLANLLLARFTTHRCPTPAQGPSASANAGRPMTGRPPPLALHC